MEIIYIILYIISGFIAVLILSFLINFLLALKKNKRLPYRRNKVKKEKFLKRIFIDFPRQFWIDKYNKPKDYFDMYGLHLICGQQGSGKTTALTEMLLRLKVQYPKVKISTNYNYKYQDSEITNWKDIVFSENGIYGKIEVIDEIQNWFNSLQSKDFPIEMITEISQQRKQKKIIVGTSQVFQRVAKPIREQVNYLYEPITILGCLTIVRVTKPKMDEDGKVVKKNHHKIYFFVHSKQIRESFDTYKKIEKMSTEGFCPRQELTSNAAVIVASDGSRRGGLLGRKK